MHSVHRRPRPPVGMFGSKAELCEQLTAAARSSGYRVFPSVGGWDLLLVCRETGEQVGVHAMLRPAIEVVGRALEREPHDSGPSVHAVLVPFKTPHFERVALRCGVVVVQGVQLDNIRLRELFMHAPRWQHSQAEYHPDHEVLVPAGVPSPRRVTKWKIAAVQLCLLARERGHVTRDDIVALGLKPHWWLSKRYGQVLTRVDGNEGRRRYVLTDPSSPLVPDLRWPEIVSAIEQSRERDRVMAAVSSRPPTVDNSNGNESRHIARPWAPTHASNDSSLSREVHADSQRSGPRQRVKRRAQSELKSLVPVREQSTPRVVARKHR